MHGIHTALITPFTADGELDLPAWERLALRQLDAGIHGLVVCGTTGETPTLTADEQYTLLAETRRIVAAYERDVPITFGVGTNNTATTVANCQRAKEAGADVGLLVFPYYNKPNPAGLRAHVEAAAATGLPLMLYHVPGRTGQRVLPERVADLMGIDGVIGVKEATGDMNYAGLLLGGTDKPVLSGDDFTFLPLLSLGGTGCVSVVSNTDPAGTVAVYDHFVAADNAAAAKAMQRILPLCHWLFSDSNPTPCKAAAAAMGLCRPDVRLPLATFAGEDPAPLLRALELL